MTTELPVSRTGATDREVEAAARYALIKRATADYAGWLAESSPDERSSADAYLDGWFQGARAAAAPNSGQLSKAWDDGYSAAGLDADEQPYSDRPEAATWKPRQNPHLAALLAEQPGGAR